MPKLPRLVLLTVLLAMAWPIVSGAFEPTTGDVVDLQPSVGPHDLAQVTLDLEVGGTMRVQSAEGPRNAKPRELPMSVAATLRYDEHRFAPRSGNLAKRSVRYYDVADAVLKVETGGLKPDLTDDRRLIVVDNPGGRLFIASPNGLLQRQELDLLDVVGDSLALDALLPTKPVAAGDTWSADSPTIAALLSLDTVADCNVASVLDKSNSDFALIKLAGVVVGTADGAPTQMDLRGVYLFDRRVRRITKFNLAVKEDRSIGGATPGLDSVAKLRLSIKPIESSEHLTAETLASLAAPSRDHLEMLQLDKPEQGFRIVHDRQWFITNSERESTSLRRVTDGDVIANCTISALPARSAGRQITLAEFERDIRYALKDNFGELVSSRQWSNAFHLNCLDVVVRGSAEGVPVEWHYYLVAPESGERVSVVVSIDGHMAQRLGAADRQLVNAIQLVPKTSRVARQPAESVERSLVVPGR
jgi:hypothetical protein